MPKWITAMAGAMALAQTISADAAAQEPAPTERPRAVTLDALLEHAEDHAPAIRVARARAEGWRVDAAAAEAPVPDDPSVQIGVGPRLQGGESDVDVSVQLRQPLEIAGEQGVRHDVSRRSRARMEAELGRVWFELHHAVHSTYHRALIDRERVEVAERQLAFTARLVEIARRRVELGEDSPLELQMAELEHLRARQRLTHERHRYLDARLSLSELTGWPADPPPVPAGDLEPPRRAPSVARLVALARESGPELAVLRAAAEEAEARADLAHREGWPEPSVGLNYQLESAPGEGQPEHQILGILSMPLPFFHRNPVGRAEAEQRLEVSRAERAALEDVLPVRLRRLAATLDAAAEQLARHRQELLPMIATRLEQLEEAFRIGEIDVLRVAAARDRLLEARLEALAAYEEYFDAVTALADAIGADPWPDAHHPEAP